jgi:hypothetical protein
LKIIKLALAIVLALTAVSSTQATSVEAKAVAYKNCTELNKRYKGGVARKGAKNRGEKTKFKPFVSDALYNANKSKDRDKDGVACEK